MRLRDSTAALAAAVVLLWAQAAMPQDFPDCNGNGVDDFVETATTFTPSGFHEEFSLLVDLDADGDLDIVGHDPLRWKENLDGAGTFGSTVMIEDRDGVVAAGDLDGDGDPELVMRSQGDCASPPAIRVYENLGSGTFTSPQVVFSMTNCGGCASNFCGRRLYLGDRDEDGDLDILSTQVYCSVGMSLNLTNDGTGHGWLQSLAQTGGICSEAGLEDLDGDGDLDLVISEGWPPEGFSWAEGPADTPWHYLWTAVRIRDLDFADLDGDGDPDFVGLRDSTEGDDVTLYENASGLGNYVETQTIVPLQDLYGTRVSLGDLDGDGDADAAWSLVWSANTNGSFGAPHALAPGLWGSVRDSGDVDLDGDLDVLGHTNWYRNDGNDCNGNRVPDECEPDCNGNGITDECDIRSGTSRDCDGNGIPDECDTGCPVGSCDQDGDGCQDGVDSAPDDSTACADTDADGCDDCSGGVFDPAGDGTNQDTDGVCDLVDCDRTNNEVWDDAVAATGLRLSREDTTVMLGWERPDDAGGISPRYDVLRSTSPSDFLSPATAQCIESDDGDESADDAEDPAAGSVFHYLVRVENDCPGGTGAMGADSAGDPRAGLACLAVASGDRLVLNEVNYGVGPNDPGQFVEVYNPSGAAVDLSGLALIFVHAGSLETMRVTLASAGELPAGGFLVAADPSVVVDPGAIELPLPGTLALRGGVALFDLDAVSLVDALSYEVSITEATFDGVPGTWNLVEGNPTVWADSYTEDGAMVRFPDGADTNDAATDWGVSGPPTGSPTPGSPNALPW
jgi:hypothetical protein